VRAQDAVAAPEIKMLSNGMRVVVVESRLAPIVETGMWYRFGSADETPGKSGLAHALEHMMFRGTPSLSYAGLENFVAHAGGKFNATTAEDYTRFYFVVPSDSLEAVMRLEVDRMQNLSLSPDAWNQERNAVLNEIDNASTNPLAKFFGDVRGAVAGENAYAWTPLGRRADVVQATVDDLRAYYDRWYAPNNATFVVVGDVHAADVFAMAERVFTPVPRRDVPAHAEIQVASPTVPREVNETAEYPFEVVDMAFAVPGIADGRITYDVQNLAYVIGDELSPFYRNEVQAGYALFASVDPDFRQRLGMVHVLYAVAPGHTAGEVREVFQRTLAAAIENGFPETLVARVRNRLVAQNSYARDSVDDFSEEIGDLYGSQDLTLGDDTANTAAVTPASVRAAAVKYFARPTVIGDLRPRVAGAGENAPPSVGGGVSDDFGARVASGDRVQPDYIRAELRKPVFAQPSRIAPTTFKIGGMTVLVQPVHDSATVVIRGEERASPAFDPPGKEGLGSTAFSLLGYGGKNADFSETEKTLGALGAEMVVGERIRARCFSKDFERVAGLLADELTTPAFPQNYVSLVLRQESESAARITTQPEYRFEKAYRELLLPKGDPELREPTPQTFGRITRDDLVAYAKRYIRPEFTTLAIVGDVNPAQVRVVLERDFGAWKGEGLAPDPALPPIPYPPAASKAIPSSGDAVIVRLGQPGITRSNPDYYALSVANVLLGHSSNSWLMEEMRMKRGLVYDVESSLNAGPDRGTITFEFGATPANLQAALSVLRAQIRRMQTELIDSGEVEGAKRVLITRSVVQESSYADIAGDVLALGVNSLPTDYYVHLGDRYRDVTPDRVREVARKYFHPEHLVEVYQGPVR
jgi:zinc protease